MTRLGQRTTFQERLEMGERAARGETDRQSAAALGCSVWTVRKWRRIGQRRGRAGLTTRLGRPARGPLSMSPPALRESIHALRQAHPGWGPLTLLAALRSDPMWAATSLPSRARIAAYLKGAELTRRYQHHSELPHPPPQTVQAPHGEWQVDAQGATPVAGVGRVSLITGVDVVSRLKVESFPSLGSQNPPTEDYFLALRRAFLIYGLPAQISLDHGTVFYDNTTPSPYPTRLHLWLVGLGVAVRFTRKRCPTDHALIERTHQTMTQQALTGQTWPDQAALWAGLDARRTVLNSQVPTPALHDQPPLQAYPQAAHSGRVYRPEWEEDLLDLDRVCQFLAHGRWFRHVRANGRFELGGYGYSLGRQSADRVVEITFAPPQRAFLCQVEGSAAPLTVPAQGLTKAALMGDLAHLLRLPVYQLAFPWSAETWRQQAYVRCLTGMAS